MKENILDVQLRQETGKQKVKQVRKRGMVPAILYGRHLETPLTLMLDRHSFWTRVQKSQSGLNTIFTLSISGGDAPRQEMAIIHDVQHEILSDGILHVDFQQINIKEKIATAVPIHIIGTAIGIKKGGQVVVLLDKLEVKCLPQNIPSKIEVNVTALDMGGSVMVRDISLSEDIEVVSSPDQMIVHVEGVVAEVEKPVEAVSAVVAPAASGDKSKSGTPASGDKTKPGMPSKSDKK